MRHLIDGWKQEEALRRLPLIVVNDRPFWYGHNSTPKLEAAWDQSFVMFQYLSIP